MTLDECINEIEIRTFDGFLTDDFYNSINKYLKEYQKIINDNENKKANLTTREMMKDCSITIREVAKEIGVTDVYLYRILSKPLNARNLSKINNACRDIIIKREW